MILADEVAGIEEKLKEKASRKELAFYNRLTGTPIEYPADENLMDIEKVCLSAFCTNAPTNIDLVDRLRRSKPIKGIYYANNVVELAAFALHSRDSETAHLKSFCSTCSARDHYIINQLFPHVCTSRPPALRSVDAVALWLEDSEFPADWMPVLFDAVQSATDLLDVYVIREAYLYLLQTNPSYQQSADIHFLAEQLRAVMSYIAGRSDWQFNSGAVFILLSLFAIVSYVAFRHWEVAEPVIWISTTGGTLILFLAMLVYGTTLDRIKFLTNARRAKRESALRKAKLDAAAIIKVLEKYESETGRFPSGGAARRKSH